MRHPSQATISVQVFYADKPMGTVTIGVNTTAASSTVPRAAPTPATTAPRAPPPPLRFVGGAPPNLLPQRVSLPPLLHVVAGLEGNRRVPESFCAPLALNETRTVTVPALVWGASVVNGDVDRPVTVQLRSGNTVLSSFETTVPLRERADAQTSSNYPGRPTQVRVARVVSGALFQQYNQQQGCFIDNTLPANSPLGQVDRPNLSIVVDPLNLIDEGEAGERDNVLQIN